jgi:hypothetical protein
VYFNKTLLSLIILVPSFYANAQDKDSAIQSNKVGWISYRDVYKEMLWFDKYGGPKHLIQSKLHILYKDTTSKFVKPNLSLIGKTVNLSLPLDAINRVTLPLIKTAYDENAELSLNSLPEQHINKVKFQSMISIHLRSDGIYEVGNLMLACDQAQQYQSYLRNKLGRKKVCLGVKIIYAEKDSIININLLSEQILDKNLILSEEIFTFEGSSLSVKSVNFYFNHVNEKAQLVTKTVPITIIPIIE